MFGSADVAGKKVELRYDPFDIGHVYAYVHNHWIECVTSSYYGHFHGHSERELILATTELREQNRRSHLKTPIDAKRLADFLAKIEVHETVLLQRERTIENQAVVYRVEQYPLFPPDTPRSASPGMPNRRLTDDGEPSSRFAPIDLTTLQVYEEYR